MHYYTDFAWILASAITKLGETDEKIFMQVHRYFPVVTLEQERRKRDGIKQLQADGRDPGQVAREEKLGAENEEEKTGKAS